MGSEFAAFVVWEHLKYELNLLDERHCQTRGLEPEITCLYIITYMLRKHCA